MSDTSLKGAIAETAIAAAAVEMGIFVLRPLVEGRRYDLMFDVDHRLYRVQCKWGRRKEGVIVVHTGTCRLTPSGYVRTTYGREEVDGIAVYCADTDECYYLPIDEVAGRSVVHLRLRPTANSQVISVKYASEYTLHGAIAQLGERRHGMAEVVGSSPTSS